MAAYDLVLKGGRVVDPGQSLDAKMDVAFLAGKVAAIAKTIAVPAGVEARDVSGLIVTPGLIDMHTHVYWGGTSLGIDAEEFCRKSAVTTAIDTGSAGPGNFAGFRKHVIEPSAVRILAYLHISHAGIFGFSNRIMVGESEELRLMDPETAVEVAAANRDLIVGIKVRLGRWASGIHGMVPFEYALQVAEEAGMPMMVHIDDPPPSYAEVVERLRKGDVLTHCFRPFPNTPSTSDGHVRPEVLAARQRGVFFDVGHGMGSFSFKVARIMLENGFLSRHDLIGCPCPLHQWPGLRPGDDPVQIPSLGNAVFRGDPGLNPECRLGAVQAGTRQFKAGGGGRRRHSQPRRGPVRVRRYGGREAYGRAENQCPRRRPGRKVVAFRLIFLASSKDHLCAGLFWH